MEHIEQATAAPGEKRDLPYEPPRHRRCKCGVFTRRVFPLPNLVDGKWVYVGLCKACCK